MKPWRAFMLVWMNYRLNLRSFAFKSTDLIYIHCVSDENFAVTVKGFTFVSLVCREVHINYVENICKRRSLIPSVVAILPADELFAGVRSPELIRILKFFLWYHGIKHLKISAIVSGLLTEKSDLRSCFCVLMYQSNRSLTSFPAREGGNLITTHRGWGIWSLASISCYESHWFHVGW